MNALRYDYPDSIVSLRLGQMYQKSGKYMDAIRHYNDFLLLNPESQLALNGIKGSELAPQWKQNPSRYIVKRMEKFNSRRGEFCPMLYGDKYDQLYFTSSRTPKGANKDKDETISAITGQRNNDFFLVKQDEQGNWLAPVELEDEVNTEFDEGTPSFSKTATPCITPIAHRTRKDRGRQKYMYPPAAAPNGEKGRVPAS